MVTVTRYEDGFRATDPGNNTVRVRATAWEPDVPAPSISDTLVGRTVGPEEPDATVTGRGETFVFPSVHATVMRIDGCDSVVKIDANDTYSPTDGEYLLRVEANVRVFCRLTAPFTVKNDGADFSISFPEPTPIAFGFEGRARPTSQEVVVPRTADGVAFALESMAAANETTTADRSWPSMRNRPPEIVFGETTDRPANLAVPETGVELVVPPTLEALLTSASLVHYLGATVRLEAGVTPQLRVGDRTERLGTGRSFVTGVTDLLRRCFYLDCAARSAGPHGSELPIFAAFETLGLDADRLYDAPIADRVEAYLAADFPRVADEFPEWHLSMHVAPTYEHVRTLPHLLPALPFVLPPAGERLSESEWLSLSLTGGGYDSFDLRGDGDRATVPAPADRLDAVGPQTGETPLTAPSATESVSESAAGGGSVSESAAGGGSDEPKGADRSDTPRDGVTADASGRDVSNVALVDPTLGPGRTHGWLAPGVPVEGFKATPTAFHNRDTYLEAGDDSLTVTVVVNDTNARQHTFETTDGPGMADEREAIVSQYERRAEELNLSVDLRRDLTVGELARLFESRHDLVHFVGHHDETGLDCRDGSLSPATLDRSRVQTFFLNACGSYPFGATLVRKGSVAGVATFEAVSDDDAFGAGATFAALIVLGNSVNRAVALASRQTIAPKEYIVVGDGTHRVFQSDALVPSEMRLTRAADGGYDGVAADPVSRESGMEVNHVFGDASGYQLSGSTIHGHLSASELDELLSTRQSPVLLDGSLVWPAELRAKL